MFRGFSQLFKKNGKDLRKRIYFTLFCLGIFCLGTQIPIPGVSIIDNIYDKLGPLQIFDLMSGGGLQTFSIFALGVSPYITASIVTQLLQMADVSSYFKELKEQGYTGRQKINKINRYVAVVLSFIQAYMLCVLYLKNPSTIETLTFALIMSAGTCFCLWLGDQITKKGIGNGTSMIIMAGIVQSMPNVFRSAYNGFVNGIYSNALGITYFVLFVLIYVAIIVGIIIMQLAEKRIPIQYSNRTNSIGSNQNYLPIKLNAANVIPVIFAQILITIPSMIAAFTNSTNASEFINKYISYTSPTGLILYLILILFFSYFYTFMVLNPEDMSKNLKNRGGYIPGVRPGKETENYISDTVGKITIVGGLVLAFLAAFPVVFQMIFSSNPNLSSISIGGTGLLIVVGVAIETYRQMESRLLSTSYKEKRKRIR